MNRQSIFFTITISFIISFILVLVSFAVLMTHGYKIKEMVLIDKYEFPIKVLIRQHKRVLNPKALDRLNDFNYELIVDKNRINAITYNPKTEVLVERSHSKHKDLVRILKLDNTAYVYMKFSRNSKTYLIKDNNEFKENIASINIYISLVFAIILIMIILVYIITLRKLMPLRVLKEKVSTLGDENFDFECCNTNRKDEVSQLALEFKKTAKKLKDIKEARNVFIRNIMHELKTPITKGKFLTELERNEKNDATLKEVFNRLESLINEFASIEELISSKNIEKKQYFLNDILDNAKDILMLEDDEVFGKYQNIKLQVNFKLFSIAVKNLIDNAIKYSDDKKVQIETNENDIIFINTGKSLEFDLEKYYEPFFANEDKSKNSFGLGLYIIHNILKANNYILEYKYEDGKNIFICKKDEK